MRLTIELATDPPMIVLTSSGRAEPDDLRHLDDFLADPNVRPGLPILADHSRLDTSGLSAWDVRELGRTYRALLEQLGDVPVAIVVSEPVTFGLARMVESYAGDPEPRQRIFYDRGDALDWLRAVGGASAAARD